MEKAVALKYEPGLPAPFVLAKGKGEVAVRMREIAEAHEVEIIEKPELTEALYVLDAGSFLPEEFFRTVAELLVFVQNTKKKSKR